VAREKGMREVKWLEKREKGREQTAKEGRGRGKGGNGDRSGMDVPSNVRSGSTLHFTNVFMR